MTGNFTIGLLEILAYLVPGGLALAVILHLRFPELANQAVSGIGYQIAFLACSYVMGHLLTFASVPLIRVRAILKWLVRGRPREKRISFYCDLQQRLRSVYGSNITRDDEYYFALRLVTENQPHSSQTIDRLYAMTLFSRNISLALLLIATLFLDRGVIVALSFLVIAALFFLRYTQLESTTANTVFRAAYVYLCSGEEQRKAQRAKTKKA